MSHKTLIQLNQLFIEKLEDTYEKTKYNVFTKIIAHQSYVASKWATYTSCFNAVSQYCTRRYEKANKIVENTQPQSSAGVGTYIIYYDVHCALAIFSLKKMLK